jgi:hypothetical protein
MVMGAVHWAKLLLARLDFALLTCLADSSEIQDLILLIGLLCVVFLQNKTVAVAWCWLLGFAPSLSLEKTVLSALP